jgi:hypothetical protein
VAGEVGDMGEVVGGWSSVLVVSGGVVGAVWVGSGAGVDGGVDPGALDSS